MTIASNEHRSAPGRRPRRLLLSAAPWRQLLLVAGVALLFSATACALIDSPVDPTGGAPNEVVAEPTFGQHVFPILEKRCAFGGCHSAVTAQGGLSLEAVSAYDQLVNVVSQQTALFRRVVPGKPDSSWVYLLVQEDPTRRFGVAGMPLSSVPLTSNQLATIRNWIARGAPRD